MTRKLVVTITAVIFFLVAATWLVSPTTFYSLFFGIQTNTELDYMARRYGVDIFALGVGLFLARDHVNSPAGKALMTGGFVAVLLTALASLYGALALGLPAWFGFGGELAAALLMGWGRFVSKEAWS